MILTSNSLNPYANLALEEHLLTCEGIEHPSLLFWRSENAVVIGKNQNPWRECNLKAMDQSSTALARRVSGGGAVYHDEGNLNVSLFMPRAQYAPAILFELLIGTLRKLGIPSELQGDNSLVSEGRKFSGSAFCLRARTSLHHATLLVSSDRDRLSITLSPSSVDIDSHAVKSNPAEVMNLTEALPSLSMSTLQEAISAAFASTFPTAGTPCEADDPPLELLRKHQSWEWIYGATPRFMWHIHADFSLTVRDGVVEGLTSDEISADSLIGQRLDHKLLNRPDLPAQLQHALSAILP